jgi:hypothetical protein
MTLVAIIGGCTAWTFPIDSGSPLRLPRMSPDSVVLEVAVLDVPTGENWDRDELWREVDEQGLPHELRHRLAADGLRAGIIGAQLPAWIRTKLEAQQRAIDLENRDGAAVLSDVATQQRLQCRAGAKRAIIIARARKELMIDRPAEQEEMASRDGDGGDADRGAEASAGTDKKVGASSKPPFQDAQCEMLLVAQPQGDGRVHLELMPQIRHGPLRRRWVANNGTFHVDAGADCERYAELQIRQIIEPGQTLVVGAGEESRGVGGAFFADHSKSGFARKILLIRLAQTQFDDLFAPGREPPPIATLGQ